MRIICGSRKCIAERNYRLAVARDPRDPVLLENLKLRQRYMVGAVARAVECDWLNMKEIAQETGAPIGLVHRVRSMYLAHKARNKGRDEARDIEFRKFLAEGESRFNRFFPTGADKC